MIKKEPYPLKKLICYYSPENLSMTGGTIESAIFSDIKLLEYKIRFPKGFEFPPSFIKNPEEYRDKEVTLKLSQNNSGNDALIFTGMSSNFYSSLMSENINKSRAQERDQLRFAIMLEQQSIISLVSVLEVFIKSIQETQNKPLRILHLFDNIEEVLAKCGVKINKLDFFTDTKIYNRTKEVINHAFNLRNLYVHNGGIVDKYFVKRCEIQNDGDKIGKLIRVNYSDYNVIRQWTSFFVQEVCRVVEGYEKVWTDYLQSTGIILSDPSIHLKLEDGTIFKIPLKDGDEIIGKFEDENEDKDE